MSLTAPYTGLEFEVSFSKLVATVAGEVRQRSPQISADDVDLTARTYLDLLQHSLCSLFNPSSYDNDAPAKVSGAINGSLTETEVILTQIADDTGAGRIPAYFINPAKTTSDVQAGEKLAKDQRPSFVSRVISTMLSPFGTTPAEVEKFFGTTFSTIVTIAEIVLVIALVIGAAYVYGKFRRK